MPSQEIRNQIKPIMKLKIRKEDEGIGEPLTTLSGTRTSSSSSSSSNSSYPTFEPHITLASFDSSIPLTSIQHSLHSTIGSIIENTNPDTNTSSNYKLEIKIKFNSIKVGDHYFRSVIIGVDSEPNGVLDKLQNSIFEDMGIQEEKRKKMKEFPHLSIVYIQDEKSGEREEFKNELEKRGLVRLHPGGVEIKIASGGEGNDWIDGFIVDQIWIVKCEGPVESWEVLDKVTLL